MSGLWRDPLKRIGGFLILGTLVVVLLRGCSPILNNVGFLLLNRSLAGSSLRARNAAQMLFLRSAESPNPNLSSQRGLSWSSLGEGAVERNLEQWRASGFEQGDFVSMAQRANHEGELAAAVQWLALAEAQDPSSAKLWHIVGKVCQKDPQIDPLCGRRLDQVAGNLLINPGFLFDRDGWFVRREEGFNLLYDVQPCLDPDPRLCAHLDTGPVAPSLGISWSQCMRLEPGKDYQFSSWIKTETDGEWRPIYIQGALDGVAKGIWPGNQTGGSKWSFWQQTFTMPNFDGQRVCFYPIRLSGTGQAWFHSPSVVAVEIP